MQIKEKFGGLRVYLDEAPTPTMKKAIEEAERASMGICDVCSKPGRLRTADGVPTATRCESHVLTRGEW